MAINSGIPNQDGLSTQYIFTAVAPGGTPGPASAPASSLKVFTPGQASTGKQGSATTETLAAAGIVVPVQQILGESNEASGLFADISAGVPTHGQIPSPAPTVKTFTGAASTGLQPAVTTPFTNSGWGTKSVV
jgi:hypothetical protein